MLYYFALAYLVAVASICKYMCHVKGCQPSFVFTCIFYIHA